MAKIHNLKELNKLGRDLEYKDHIHFTTKFKVIRCSIHENHLKALDYEDSYTMIFDYLCLNVNEKYKLAEKCYGYKTPERCQHPENWPHYKNNDFKALERLIREIYKRLDDNSVEVLDTKELIINRFEILDL